MVLTVYAIAMLMFWIIACAYMLVMSEKIQYVKDIAPIINSDPPSVAIIIAVRNEEAELEEALKSVCGLHYKNYKVIVVNDRSTDATPMILNRLKEQHPQISIITINELPAGWLGKNHALYTGYLSSNAEWLLFTDADILYKKDTLDKAMNYALQKSLDHLTVLPHIISSSPIFKSVINTFALMLEAKLKPWNVSKQHSKASIGVGAFNLVKREAYEKAGTHQVISLRPDDDLKLGAIIKNKGLKQDVLYGNDEICLKWYASLNDFIKGLMKNTFSVADYNLFIAFGMALSTLVVIVLPVSLLLLSGFPFFFAGIVILLAQAFLFSYKKGLDGKWWQALLVPFSGLIMVYIIAASALLTIKQGGIYWRNSFYSLKELKKQS